MQNLMEDSHASPEPWTILCARDVESPERRTQAQAHAVLKQEPAKLSLQWLTMASHDAGARPFSRCHWMPHWHCPIPASLHGIVSGKGSLRQTASSQHQTQYLFELRFHVQLYVQLSAAICNSS